jgi:hypothetical protein
MPTYLNLQDGAAQVAGTGLALKGLAADLDTQAKAILAEIQSIEAKKPWGNDETGQTFEASYNQVPQNGDTAFSKSLQDELGGAGKTLSTIGDNIVNAVADFRSTDVDNSETIINV